MIGPFIQAVRETSEPGLRMPPSHRGPRHIAKLFSKSCPGPHRPTIVHPLSQVRQNVCGIEAIAATSGEVTGLLQAAGASPRQDSIETML